MSVINLKLLQTHPVSDTLVFYCDIDNILYDYFKFKRYNDNSYDLRMDTGFYICQVNLEVANIDKIIDNFVWFLSYTNDIMERKISIELSWVNVDDYKENMSELDEEMFSLCYDYFHMMSKDEVEESEKYESYMVSQIPENIDVLKDYIKSYNDKLKWLAYYRNKRKIEKLESNSKEEYKEYILQAFNSYLFINMDDNNIIIGMSGNLYKNI